MSRPAGDQSGGGGSGGDLVDITGFVDEADVVGGGAEAANGANAGEVAGNDGGEPGADSAANSEDVAPMAVDNNQDSGQMTPEDMAAFGERREQFFEGPLAVSMARETLDEAAARRPVGLPPRGEWRGMRASDPSNPFLGMPAAIPCGPNGNAATRTALHSSAGPFGSRSSSRTATELLSDLEAEYQYLSSEEARANELLKRLKAEEYVLRAAIALDAPDDITVPALTPMETDRRHGSGTGP